MTSEHLPRTDWDDEDELITGLRARGAAAAHNRDVWDVLVDSSPNTKGGAAAAQDDNLAPASAAAHMDHNGAANARLQARDNGTISAPEQPRDNGNVAAAHVDGDTIDDRERTNSVWIVGSLALVHRRDGEVVGNGRSEYGADVARLQLEIDDGVGTPYELPIELAHGLYLEQLREFDLQRGTRVVVRGRMDRRGRFDRRFIDWRNPADVGRFYRELCVTVHAIRLAQPTEPGGSFVRLRGRIVDPPQFPRGQAGRVGHAAGMLEVIEKRPSPLPFSRVVDDIATLIPWEVSLGMAGVEGLLRRDNQVYVEARLERYRANVDVGNSAMEPLVAQLQADAEAAQQLGQPNARRAAERRLYGRKMELVHPYRTRVRIGYVELLAGRPCSPDEAMQLREAFVHSRVEGRRRRERRTGSGSPEMTHTSYTKLQSADTAVAELQPASVAASSEPTGGVVEPETPAGDGVAIPKRNRKRQRPEAEQPPSQPPKVLDGASASGHRPPDTEAGTDEIHSASFEEQAREHAATAIDSDTGAAKAGDADQVEPALNADRREDHREDDVVLDSADTDSVPSF